MLVLYSQVFWVVSLMPVLYSQVHVHPGSQVPREEELCGHHEDRIWYEDVRHTQNTFTLKAQWEQNREWRCSPNPQHLRSKSSMRTVSDLRMFVTPRTPHEKIINPEDAYHTQVTLYENRITREDVHYTQNTFYEDRLIHEDAHHTQITLYENRVSREDVHHTQNTSWLWEQN